MKYFKLFFISFCLSLTTSGLYLFISNKNELYYKIELKFSDNTIDVDDNISYKQRYSFRDTSGNIVIVNNNRKVLEMDFDDSLNCSSLRYYFEDSLRLYREDYICDSFKLCMIQKIEVSRATLPGKTKFKSEIIEKNFEITSREIKGFTPTDNLCKCQ